MTVMMVWVKRERSHRPPVDGDRGDHITAVRERERAGRNVEMEKKGS